MKRIYLAALGFLAFLGLTHGGLYLLNRDLHPPGVVHLKPRPSLAQERLALEARAQRELTSYGYVDERKEYAKIPLERAFDYYLRSVVP